MSLCLSTGKDKFKALVHAIYILLSWLFWKYFPKPVSYMVKEKKGNILMFHSSSSMIKSGGKHLPKTTKNLFGINSLEALSWETWFCLFKKSNMYLIVYIVAFELETWKHRTYSGNSHIPYFIWFSYVIEKSNSTNIWFQQKSTAV